MERSGKYVFTHPISVSYENLGLEDCEWVIEEGVGEIGKDDVPNRDKVTRVILPDSLKAIGDNTLGLCSSLGEFYFDGSLLSLAITSMGTLPNSLSHLVSSSSLSMGEAVRKPIK